ncbi:MAG TPA: rod shape-determining protein MreC [Methylophilaceae bacterium]|nr:rod shape-determining protein MreC [Methylophilaceae bacterium]
MLKGVHQKLEPQESLAFFVRGPSPFSRMMFFCALSLVLMAVDARFNYLSQFRQAFIAALHPLEMIANAPSQLGMNIKNYLSSHNALLKENQALKLKEMEQQVLLQRLSTIESENTHLRSLLKGNAPIIPKAILGEIMHMGRDPFSNVIVINRGSNHGVSAGQAVVDADGVIGQVTRTYPFSSEVTLVTDKNLSIPIQIERNQLRAIAFGEGKSNTLDIPFLPTSVDIKVGDKLVTSGIDGIYPSGLAVATVTQIKQSPDSPFAKIISTPTAGVNSHSQLLILSMPQPETIQYTEETSPTAPKKAEKKQETKPNKVKAKPDASR